MKEAVCDRKNRAALWMISAIFFFFGTTGTTSLVFFSNNLLAKMNDKEN